MTTSNNVYTNPDGLKIRFGTDKAKPALVGSASAAGDKKQITAIVDTSVMQAFGTTTLLDETTSSCIPSGSIITQAQLNVISAFTGATATLSIGLYHADGTTAFSETAIDDTIALTAINAVGKQVACDGASVNGAALTDDAYLSVLAGTATFTGGKAQLTITYVMPANRV